MGTVEDVRIAVAGATPSTIVPVVKAFAPTAWVLVKMASENDAAPIVAAAVVYFLLLWPVVRLLSRLENRAIAGRG